jgi:hypothetical protein
MLIMCNAKMCKHYEDNECTLNRLEIVARDYTAPSCDNFEYVEEDSDNE